LGKVTLPSGTVAPSCQSWKITPSVPDAAFAMAFASSGETSKTLRRLHRNHHSPLPFRDGGTLHPPPRTCQTHVSATYILRCVSKSVLNERAGRFHFKRPVGSLGIVPEEVLHLSPVCLQDVELSRVKGASAHGAWSPNSVSTRRISNSFCAGALSAISRASATTALSAKRARAPA